MSQKFMRKAQPDCLQYILSNLHNAAGTEGAAAAAGCCTIEQLVNTLVKDANYARPTASETISGAVHDGLIVIVPSRAQSPRVASPRGRLHENKLVRLPQVNEITHSTHDSYCFECHLPGTLEHCRTCVRSFHLLCYRKDAERPNYAVPSPKLQRNPLPAFSSETDSSSADENDDGAENASITHGYESELRASSSLLPVDQLSLASQTPPQRFPDELTIESTSSPVAGATTTKTTSKLADSQYESKMKCEVVCLGVVREPTRRRPATTGSSISYKSELSPNDDEEDADKELCTCCRLLKYAALRNPPNMDADELCHLINFTFERNRSWLMTDIPTFLDTMKLTPTEIKVATALLFKMPALRLDDIDRKIQKREYNLLMEFFVDLLDIQHNIGVFFGPYSTEMESTKWLVRDIAHDLSEIRRCSDCFRHSHEKLSSIWFAKPCVQRHELVFAKHSGFTYWPAKVIRVLPNNKYDVRFFGSNHSRALIDVRFIRSIDTDIKSLRLGNSIAIKKAMEELRYHQILSAYSPSIFSFHADREETEQIIRNLLVNGGGSGTAATSGRKRGRKRKLASEYEEEQANHSSNTTMLTSLNSQQSIAEQAGSNNTTNATVIYNNDNNNHITHTTKPSLKRRGRPPNPNNDKSKRVTRSINKPNDAGIIKKIQEELQEALKVSESAKQKESKLIAQVQKLKETIRKKEIENKIIKRKQWCYWCLNEGRYLCCFRATYCSKTCQARHWKDGHSSECKNEQILAAASKTATTSTT